MINQLGPVPTPLDSAADFNTKAFGLLAQLPGFVTETNATADTIQINADILAAVLLGMALPDYAGTSASSVTVGTGPKVFATQTGKLWVPGQIVVISSGGNILRGPVVSYTGGNLTVNVTSTVGSGTFSSWTIGLTFDGLLLAKSGANNDITSLNALASVPAVVAQYSNQIKTIGASVAANALTITAGALSLDFRSTTLGSGAVTTVSGTPANLVVPSTQTLGTTNGVQSDLIVLALNNAGTIELAVVNLAGGNDLSETGLISTISVGTAGNASNIYSTTARTNVAYRVIGLIRSTQSIAGTWATAPTLVQGMGGNALDAMQSLGYGQTWQNVTGSRVVGTTYYNTTGRPIQAAITGASGTSSGGSIIVNGLTVITNSASVGGSVNQQGAAVVIPAGASYSVINFTLGTWFELR